MNNWSSMEKEVEERNQLLHQETFKRKSNANNRHVTTAILGFGFLESLGFFGVSTNLVMYLSNVLHESNTSVAKSITNWAGASFFTPFLGALIADSYLGCHKTIVYSSILYILGMSIVTFSSSLPSLRPPPCDKNTCPSATNTQNNIFFTGLYFIAFGGGGVKSSLLPLGASQFSESPLEIEKRGSFFNWFYFFTNVGALIAGSFIVWVQDNISWSLGYIISTICMLFAVLIFMVRVKRPSGDNTSSVHCFRDHKMLLDLFPIWMTGIIFSTAYAQLNTTFIMQGKSMNTNIKPFTIPPASLVAFETVSVIICVSLYDRFVVRKLTLLQRMGIGHIFMVLAMLMAAATEARRLMSKNMHILWQMPQYFMVAGSEVFFYIGQIQFFLEQGPGSMKSLSTSLSLLTISLGSYLSSFMVAIVSRVTTWIGSDVDDGRLDCFFLFLGVVCLVNFACYVSCVKRFKNVAFGSGIVVGEQMPVLDAFEI